MATVRVGYNSERFADRVCALLPVNAGKLKAGSPTGKLHGFAQWSDAQREHYEHAEYVVTSYGLPIAAYATGRGWAVYERSTTRTTRRHMTRVARVTRAHVIA